MDEKEIQNGIGKLLEIMEERLYKVIPSRDRISTVNPLEKALFILLRENKKDLPPINDYFHKAFRATDVIQDSPYLDTVIWLLLQESTLFWECYGLVRRDIEDGSG